MFWFEYGPCQSTARPWNGLVFAFNGSTTYCLTKVVNNYICLAQWWAEQSRSGRKAGVSFLLVPGGGNASKEVFHLNVVLLMVVVTSKRCTLFWEIFKGVCKAASPAVNSFTKEKELMHWLFTLRLSKVHSITQVIYSEVALLVLGYLP